MTVVVDVSMSLDGYIAGPNDEIEPLHDWLFAGDVPSRHAEFLKPAEEGREILDAAIDAGGATVTGRRTFEAAKRWGGEPLFGMPTFVVTHDPPDDAPAFTYVEGVESAIEQARAAAGEKNVGLMGASIAQQALAAGLLEELHLHIVPVVLGRGIPLFAGGVRADLELTRLRETPGVVHLDYRVRR